MDLQDYLIRFDDDVDSEPTDDFSLWLFRTSADSDGDPDLEFITEHHNFYAAYAQWADESLVMFDPGSKMFYSVLEVMVLKMAADGELPDNWDKGNGVT